MITDIQVGTASTCIRMFQQSCGLHSMKNVAIITTMWNNVTSHTGEQWEKALGALFKPLLDDGAVIMRHDRTPESATAIINHLLNEHTTPYIAHELEDIDIPPEETVEAKKNKAPTKAEDDRSVIWNKTSSVADEEPANELPGVPMKGARRRNETGCVLTSNQLGACNTNERVVALSNFSRVQEKRIFGKTSPEKARRVARYSVSALSKPNSSCVMDCVQLLIFVKYVVRDSFG